jgi:fatty acid desaturase
VNQSSWDRETRAWFVSLDGPTRLAIRDLHTVRPWRNAVLLLHLGIWAAACAWALSAPSWPGLLLAYGVMGLVLHGLGVLMHEAVHGTFFRRRLPDRFAAFLLGAPILIPSEAFRVTHLLHHKHTRDPEDPDELTNNVRGRRAQQAAFYALLFIGMPVFLLHVTINGFRLGTWAERRRILLQLSVMGAAYAAALTLPGEGGARWVVHGWLWPIVASSIWVSLRGWAEHLCTPPGHALTQARTVTTNPVLRFFIFNINFHLEHHLFPGVPWYNLQRLHALLSSDLRKAGALPCRSYLRLFWDSLRGGVHGVVPARPVRVSPN